MITKRITRISKGMRFLHVVALIFILGFIAAAPPWAHADIPRYINYQGKLLDAEDNPVTGEVDITVRIYNAATGGTALWEETQAVTVTRGIFSVLLGNTEALDDLDFNSAYWYSVEVEDDGEMTPMQRLTAVAYAINADKLDGYDASDFLQTAPSGDLTLTGGANEDILIDPTGTGNVIITIDSTSGDFKITDGTTNFVLVDSETGNVTVAKDLTVSGTIYGTLASTGGDSTFSSIVVTGSSDLRGNISNSSASGAVTIADALTQTGSTNQVTLAGNLDANAGVDVTGALTVSGATTLSSGLDMNSNIDLDYSGASAALDVTQASTGAAAQFSGGRVIVGANETSNAYALSTGELYVLGDLEVDGTIYGSMDSSGARTFGATTLSSLTVSGASNLQGNIDAGAGIDITGAANFAGGTTYKVDSTGAATLKTLDITQTDASVSGTATTAIVQPAYQDSGTNSTTTAVAMNIAPTINYTGATKSGSYTALKIAATETSLPTGSNYLIDARAGADGTTQKFYVDNSGNAKIFGALNMNSQRITNVAATTSGSPSTDVATKGYVDSITPATAGGWTDGGTGVYLTASSDNVGIGTTSTGTYKLNVAGATNTTSFYIGGTQVTATATELNLIDGYTGTTANLNTLTNASNADTLHTHTSTGVTSGVVLTAPSSDQTIQPTAATITPLILKGASSQSDNLLEFRDSSSNLLTYVDPSGRMLFDLGSGDYALAIAESLTAGAQNSAAKIYFGRNATDNWETIGYDPTLEIEDTDPAKYGKFTFSAPLQIEASSPTGITFVEHDTQGDVVISRSLMYDSTKDEFSFTGGKLKQAFQNIIRNGSFESHKPSGWENHNVTLETNVDIVDPTDTVNFPGAPSAKFGGKYIRIIDTASDATDNNARGMRYYVPMPDRFVGESLTMSVWARAASDTATASIGYSYTASPANASKAKNISLTTTWTQYSWTFPDVVTASPTIYVYLYAAGVNAPDGDGVGTITGTATNSVYAYFDGITLVQGKLALDYGPTPILDTGNQIMYGNLAIGANTDPTTGGTGMPTLIFGEPSASFYYSGYGGWSMESGQIRYEQLGGYASGRFMFNKPIRIYPAYSDTWGAGFYLGENVTANYAHHRIDAYIQGRLEVDGIIYGDGSGLINLPASSISGTAAITGISGNTFTINEDATSPSEDMMLSFNRGSGQDATIIWAEASDKFFVSNHVNISNGGLNIAGDGNLTVAGTITAGSGLNTITTAAGLLDATKLTGTVPAGSLPSDGYASTYVNVTGDTMTGELTLTHTGVTNGTQILDINSTGIITGTNTKTIASISDSANHTTSGAITGMEIAMAGTYYNGPDPTALSIDLSGVAGTAGTERGINITMGATTDLAINTNAKIIAGTLSDGTANISSGAVSGVADVNVNNSGTFTFKDSDGNTIVQLDEATRTAQIYNLTVNGTQTVVNTTVTDADHWSISPGAIGTTAISISPDAGVTLSGNLITAKKVSTGGNVFVVDKDGNITTVGTVDSVDVSAHDVATTVVHGVGAGEIVGTTLSQILTNKTIDGGSNTLQNIADSSLSTIATANKVSGSAVQLAANGGLANSTGLKVDYDNSTIGISGGQLAVIAGYAPSSHSHLDADIADDLTITSTKAGSFAALSTSGRVGIGLASPTADLSVRGNLSTALANTATSSGVTVTCIAHGLAADDAVKMPTAAGGANEIFTVASVTDANTFVVDSTPTNDLISAATIYKDSNLLLVQSGDAQSMLTLDKSGNLTVAGDLNVAGDQIVTGSTQYQGAQTITATSTTAFLVENADGVDTFVVDTLTPQVNVLTNLDVSGTLKAGTNDAFQVTADGALTAAGLNAGSGLITTTGSITTTAGGVMTSAGLLTASGGMSVSGSMSMANGGIAITDASNVILNTNMISLYGATGNATFAGALTQLRSVGLSPEYDNAILRPDGADNFGTMVLKSDTTDAALANRRSYYEWTTSEPATQDCDIVVKYRLPDGFSSFDSTPIKLWNKVSATPGNTGVTVTMLDTAGSAVTLTGGSNLRNTSWAETEITLDATGKTFSPGGYVTLVIKLSAGQGKVADVGELTLKGNW